MEAQKLSLVLSNREEVHNHYLPMLQGGGLFVPTSAALDFGDEVIITVDLLSEKQKAQVPGRVAWINPAGAQRTLMKGVGIQFLGEHQPRIQQYFESLVGDKLLEVPQFPSY